MKRPTQCDSVLELLRDGDEHSTRELQDACGGLRVPPRVDELRDLGHTIECRRRGRGRSAVYLYRLVSTSGTRARGEGRDVRRPGHALRPIDDCMRCGKREPLIEDSCGDLICNECAAPPEPWLVTCPTCRKPKRATAAVGLIYLTCGHFTHRDHERLIAADEEERRAS